MLNKIKLGHEEISKYVPLNADVVDGAIDGLILLIGWVTGHPIIGIGVVAVIEISKWCVLYALGKAKLEG